MNANQLADTIANLQIAASCPCCSQSSTVESDVLRKQRPLSLQVDRAHDEDASDADTQSSPSSPISSSEIPSSPSTSNRSDDADADVDEPDEEEDAPAYLNQMLEQSPIDIREMATQHLNMAPGDIEVALGHVDAEILHKGSNFQVNWHSPDRNYLRIKDKIFHTVQFHFHTPSEHTINGEHEDMEFHLVHQAADGNLAVVAVFFREGKENPFLAQFWHELPELDPLERKTVSIGKINPQHLDVLSGRFFRYRGSLTTPPYTEGVEWIVNEEVVEASREQIETFRQLLPTPHNARAVQPLNKRSVSLVL